MIRLLKIEWFKLRHYRPFWVLIIMYGVLVTLLCSSGMFFMNFLKKQGAEFKGFDPTMIPLYDFPDVWQNMTYIAAYFKIILAFIVVMSIFNELNHRIVRQNIIDGLSKKEWLSSKLIFIAAISAGVTVLLFLNGLIMGLIYSHPDGYRFIFDSTQFLLAYFLGTFTFLTFAMLLTLLVRKGGLVIVGLFMYFLMFEPFLTVFLEEFPKMPDYLRPLAHFFPVKAIRNLIHVPYPRYVFAEIQDFVSFKETLIVLCWLCFNVGMSYLILKKKDL